MTSMSATIDLDAPGSVTLTFDGGLPSPQPVEIPSGRLTLTSGQAVQCANAIAAPTVYYTPYTGNAVPIWDGTNFVSRVFAELSLALDSNAAHPGYHAAGAVMDLIVFDDAGTLRLGTGPAWSGPNLIGTGAGSAQRSKVGAIWTNAVAASLRFGINSGDMRTVAAGAGTIVGSISFSANGQTEYTISPTAVSGGTANKLLLSNIYHREPVLARNKDVGTINFNVAAGFTGGFIGAGMQIKMLCSLPENPLEAEFAANVSVGGSAGPTPFIGIGLDSTSILATNTCLFLSGVSTGTSLFVKYSGTPGLGLHYVQPMAGNVGSGTGVINGDIYAQFTAGMLM